MSQVNDALKRVRDTQRGASRPTDAPAPRLPTPTPTPTPPHGTGLILPIAFAVAALIGLIGLILLWQLRQKQTAPIATMNPAPASAPIQIASVAPPGKTLPAAAPKASASRPMAALPAPAAAASSASVIRLQGILYTSHGSTAVISGQTVAAGDEVGGYRVAAIGEHSVTLVNGTRTNVLSLNR